ncbi:MAG: Fur family transcriptional regulator [Hyphomicrobiaceae bacterium]|nr:Fur family transcriptional regulator [Hyphomicrobiaceae bacterium]
MTATHAGASFPEPGHNHGTCLADSVARAETVFQRQGLRLTPLRRQVLEEVAGSHAAIGAYEVLERMARKGGKRLAPISIYRALDSLVEAGVVHRLESRNAFFACHAPHTANRRQVILACEKCGTVAEVAGSAVFDEIDTAAKDAGFTAARALVEVIGSCGRCDADRG